MTLQKIEEALWTMFLWLLCLTAGFILLWVTTPVAKGELYNGALIMSVQAQSTQTQFQPQITYVPAPVVQQVLVYNSAIVTIPVTAYTPGVIYSPVYSNLYIPQYTYPLCPPYRYYYPNYSSISIGFGGGWYGGGYYGGYYRGHYGGGYHGGGHHRGGHR